MPARPPRASSAPSSSWAWPGIPNLDLAMQEGWSTASAKVREMGYGAGMGLPNIKKNTDDLKIDTEVGVGTTVTMTVYLV